MMTIVLIFGSGIIGLLLWQRHKFTRRRPQLPGPRGLPFFGNIFQLDSKFPHIQLTEWGNQYGDLYLLRLLGNNVVVVSGERSIRQALFTDTEAFAGRPQLTRASIAHRGGFYVSLGDICPRWRLLKKLVLGGLRRYQCERLETVTLREIQKLLDTLEEGQGQAREVKDDIQGVMANLDFSSICGRGLESRDVKLFIQTEAETLPLLAPSGRGCELDLAPWLRYFPSRVVKALRDIEKKNRSIFAPAIDQCQANHPRDVTCVLDCLLDYNAETSSTGSEFSDKDIRATVEDLCTAGISTSSAVTYGLLTLCTTLPHLQCQLQNAIDDVIGVRPPSLSDRPKLPLVEAVVLEFLRFMTPVPITVPHKTTRDVTLDGVLIPKDTHVLINLWSLHHDERYWDEPWDFKPDRFLTSDGQLVPPDHPNRKRLLPFGGGRRLCAGVTVAKARLFLLLTSVLQRFTLLPEEGMGNVPLQDPRHFTGGIVLYPTPMKIRFVSRGMARRM